MNKTIAVACLAAWAVLVGGCEQGFLGSRPAIQERKDTPREADYLAKAAVRADEQTEGESAVRSALEWAKKYAEKCDEVERVNRENQRLLEGSATTTKKAAKLEADLGQAQRELQEANAMLLELRKELGDWKRDVLGYREEMRAAQKAQLEAMTKVLRLLGGEVPAQAAATQPAGGSVAAITAATDNKDASRAAAE